MFKPTAIVLVLVGLASAAAWFILSRPSADQLLTSAQAALDRSDRAEAERLTAILEQRRRPDYVHYLRGKAAVLDGRNDLELAARPERQSDRLELGQRAKQHFSSALQHFEQVPKDSTLHFEAGTLAGECFARLGNQKQAVEAFQYVLKRQPEHAAAHRWLADIYFELGATDEALKHLRVLQDANPEDGHASWQIGHIYDSFGRKGDATASYREALKRRLKPGAAADVVRALGVLLVSDGLYAELLDLLDRFPATPARQADYFAMRGECLWGLGRPEEARELSDKALQINADLPPALWLRARIHISLGELREAIPLLEKVLKQEPHNLESRTQLAQACERLGDAAAAAEHRRLFEQSRALHDQVTVLSEEANRKPWDADIRCRIAETLMKMDRPAKARPWLQAALSCNPKHRAAAELLRQIKTQ